MVLSALTSGFDGGVRAGAPNSQRSADFVREAERRSEVGARPSPRVQTRLHAAPLEQTESTQDGA